jgi:predicted secreted Zn-dependent protease
MLTIFTLLLSSIQATAPVATAISTAAAKPAAVTATVPATAPVVIPQPVVVASVPAVVPAAPAPQACIPPVFTAAAPLALSVRPAGLNQIIEPTTYYRVYGNTAAQIKTQLQQCPALSRTTGTFGAATGSNVTWQYAWTINSAGTCTISAVKVGLHINMILPAWESTNTAASGLAADWQRMITNLAGHENGHVAVYQQYAVQLLQDLQSLPAADCAAAGTQAEAKAAAVIAAMNSANAAYDVHTHHGVAQGVVLH